MDNLMSGGVLAFSLFEDGGTVYQLDGTKISPQSTLDLPRLIRRNAKGGESNFGKQAMLQIRHSDAALHASMDAGDHNVTQWKFALAGFNWQAVCYDTNTFVVEETPQFDPESEEYPFQIRYELTAGVNIANGINMIATYLRSQNLGIWQDADADNLADGFSNVGVETVAFAAGVQTLNNSSGAGEAFVDIPFPVEGLDWTFAETVDALRGGTPDFTVEFLDVADAVLGSATATINSTGEITATATAPAGTFTLRFHLAIDTVAFDLDVSNPTGRLDGKTTYIAG